MSREASVDILALDPLEICSLNAQEQHIDERIRTLSQAITACGVILAGMYFFKRVLVPFVLALALKYLLTPLIDALSCHGSKIKLPRTIAVLLSVIIALSLLSVLGLILAKSVSTFSSRADFYGRRVAEILTQTLIALRSMLPVELVGEANELDPSQTVSDMLSEIQLSSLIMSLLGTAAHVAENVLYITLFLMFMLLGQGAGEKKTGVAAKIDKQIFIYIRGKVAC